MVYSFSLSISIIFTTVLFPLFLVLFSCNLIFSAVSRFGLTELGMRKKTPNLVAIMDARVVASQSGRLCEWLSLYYSGLLCTGREHIRNHGDIFSCFHCYPHGSIIFWMYFSLSGKQGSVVVAPRYEWYEMTALKNLIIWTPDLKFDFFYFFGGLVIDSC